MERLRATGADHWISGPNEARDEWKVWVFLNRVMTDDEVKVLRDAWRGFDRASEHPVLHLPQVTEDRAHVRIRLNDPDELPLVAPKLQELLGRVHDKAHAIERQRRADSERVREVAESIDWEA